ncbi:MAG: M20/M25/M40 family metallo-hydrolase [Sphaerochaetaceae bacterium]|nr:M20/M25/M40 family metallo-hydrolase [Sphaerochaetaceae bacterium]
MTDRESKYATLLSEMIQCETISQVGVQNKDKFDHFHEVLGKLFPQVFSKCEIVEIDSSLLIRLPGKTDGEAFLFMSHQDVVPAEGKWEHEPFSGDVTDGIVWGRGTVDTKGPLMCMLQAMEELIEEGFTPEVDMYIASSSTEEVSGDGAPKTVKYLQDHGVRLQLLMDEGGMIVDEPMGGVNGRFAMIGTLEKGYVDFKVIAKSNGGHASTPSKNSPLARLGAFMVDIEKHNPNKAQMSDTVMEMLRRMGPYTKGAMGFVFRHVKLFKPLLEKIMPMTSATAAAMVRTTMAFTMMEGSSARNVIPEEAYLNINSRLIHHQGLQATTEILKRYCDKYDLELEILDAKEPQAPVDFTQKAFRTVEETVKEFYPDVVPTPYVMTGGTDAYYYWPVTDNAIRFAPLVISEQQLHSIHALNENIGTASLPTAVDFYKSIAKKMK